MATRVVVSAAGLLLVAVVVVVVRFVATSGESDNAEGIIDYGPTSTTSRSVVASTAPSTTLLRLPSVPVDKTIPVSVLNNSLVVGLGSRVAAQLTGDGWTNVRVGNYAGGTLNRPTVYYGANFDTRATPDRYWSWAWCGTGRCTQLAVESPSARWFGITAVGPRRSTASRTMVCPGVV